MRTSAYRHTALAGLAAVALITAGCTDDKDVDASMSPQVGLISTSTVQTPPHPAEVKLIGERDVEVTLTGPIAAKYSAAAEAQKSPISPVDSVVMDTPVTVGATTLDAAANIPLCGTNIPQVQ